MPVWTFTSGPNKGKKYEGSACVREEEGGRHDGGEDAAGTGGIERVKAMVREEKLSWGRVDRLSCRRNTRVVKGHSRAYLATFDLVEMGSSADCNQRSGAAPGRKHKAGVDVDEAVTAAANDAPRVFSFRDVPVVLEGTMESGEPVAIRSHVVEGDAVRVKLLSEFTCVFEKMSAADLELEVEAARRREKLQHLRKSESTASSEGSLDVAKTMEGCLSKGNVHLKAGFYGQAHACYQKGQEFALRAHHCLPSNQAHPHAGSGAKYFGFEVRLMCVKLYANGALAQVKLNDLNGAAKSCNTGLHLVKRNLSLLGNIDVDVGNVAIHQRALVEQWRVRILLRRASARLASKVYEAALEDLAAVLEAEPRNMDAAELKRKVEEAMKMSKLRANAAAAADEGEAGFADALSPKENAFWRDVLEKARKPVT